MSNKKPKLIPKPKVEEKKTLDVTKDYNIIVNIADAVALDGPNRRAVNQALTNIKSAIENQNGTLNS